MFQSSIQPAIEQRRVRMTTQSLDRHIEISPGIAGGKPRIAGHRITVQDIAIWHERLGRSVDEISTEYGLTLAEIHAALAYYFDHRQEIDQSIRDGDSVIEALRNKTPSALQKKLAHLGDG